MNVLLKVIAITMLVLTLNPLGEAWGQTPPSSTQRSTYSGLHAAALTGDVEKIAELVGQGAKLEQRDSAGRTPLHVAVYQSNERAVSALVKAGANINAYENDDYDAITIAAVANDLEMMNLAISLGGNPKNITSPYVGTALIAAAHLGHVEIVKSLIKAGSPLDHVNNLGWTALMESVVLGDGGPRHVEVAGALIEAGADVSITDRQGITPLERAKSRGYTEMIARF